MPESTSVKDSSGDISCEYQSTEFYLQNLLEESTRGIYWKDQSWESYLQISTLRFNQSSGIKKFVQF